MKIIKNTLWLVVLVVLFSTPVFSGLFGKRLSEYEKDFIQKYSALDPQGKFPLPTKDDLIGVLSIREMISQKIDGEVKYTPNPDWALRVTWYKKFTEEERKAHTIDLLRKILLDTNGFEEVRFLSLFLLDTLNGRNEIGTFLKLLEDASEKIRINAEPKITQHYGYPDHNDLDWALIDITGSDFETVFDREMAYELLLKRRTQALQELKKGHENYLRTWNLTLSWNQEKYRYYAGKRSTQRAQALRILVKTDYSDNPALRSEALYEILYALVYDGTQYVRDTAASQVESLIQRWSHNVLARELHSIIQKEDYYLGLRREAIFILARVPSNKALELLLSLKEEVGFDAHVELALKEAYQCATFEKALAKAESVIAAREISPTIQLEKK